MTGWLGAGAHASAVTALIVDGILGVMSGLVLLVALIAARRALRQRGERRDARLAAPARPLLLAVVADDEPSAGDLARLAGLDRRTWAALEPTVVSLLSQVRGSSQRALAHLLVARGGEEAALRRARRPGCVGRARATELLAAAGTPAAIDALIERLADRDSEVRAVATRALGRIAAPSAAAPLLAGLDGRRPLAPALVAQALVRIGTPAVPALVGALDDPSAPTRRAAAEALGLLGAVGAVGVLARLVADDDSLAVRVRSAGALGRIGAPQALTPLVAATDPDRPEALRTAAARALGELGDGSAVPVLRSLVGDGDGRVAHEAAAALATFGPGGHQALEELADDADDRAAAHASEALATLRLRRLPQALVG